MYSIYGKHDGLRKFFIVSMLLLFLCPAASFAAEKEKSVAWTLTHCCSPNTGWGKAVQSWVDRVKEESNGRIVITIYSNGQLSGGNQQKEIELVQTGDIQAGVFPFGILSTQEPKYNIVALPFAVSDYAQGDKVLSGPEGKKLLSYLDAKALKGIAVASAGFRQFLGREKALVNPEDFHNAKIRVMPGELWTMIFRQLNADPVVMNYADVYTALQQKALSAIEMPPSFILSDKFYEVAKHLTLSNYHYQAAGLVANKNAWNKLSDKDQNLIQKLADEVFRQQRRDVEADDNAAIAQMKRLGVTVYHLNQEQLAAYQKKMDPIYELFTKRHGSAVTEFLNACKAAR